MLNVDVHGFDAMQKDASFMPIIIDMSAHGSKPLTLAFRALYLNPATFPLVVVIAKGRCAWL
jgi:hypothetical protein